MVDQIAMVTFTTPASPGTISVTDPSITEPFSAAILIFTRETSDGTDNEHAIVGVGFIAPDTTPTTEEHAYSIRADGSAAGTTPDTSTDHDSNRAINAMEGPTGVAAIVAEYAGSIPGGFDLSFLTVLDPGSGAIRTKCTAILFAGLERAYTDACTGSTGGTSEAVGGATDFEPHVVIFTSTSSAVNVSHNDATPNIGFACNTSPIQQVANYQRWNDTAEPSDADSYLRDDAAFATFPTTAEQYSSVTAFTSTGFNHTANASSPSAHYLALRFSGNVRLSCAHLDVSGATGVQTFPFDFTPDLLLGMSSLMTAQNTLVDGALAAAFGYFVTGRYGSRAYTAHAQEGQSGTGFNCRTRQEDVAVLTYDDLGNIAQRATWLGHAGGGFALDFSVATAGTLTVLGIQLIPTDPPQRRHRPHRARARFQRRRRIQLAGGVPIGNPPLLGRLLREVARMRRRALARFRRPPAVKPLTGVRLTGTATEEGSKGRVFRPGLYRGRITGTGVPTRDPDQ